MSACDRDGDTLYAWQVQEPSGEWSMVAAMVPGIGEMTPLINRSLMTIRRAEGLARAHAEATSQPLRLAKFALAEVLE